MTRIRTRFAPSPTGSLHIGGLRSAVYPYALAKHDKGDFILRIEDTDKKREVAGGIEKIKETLKIFGIEWDEFYIQTELAKDDRYKKAAEKLVEQGHAFYCECKAKNAKEEGYSKVLRDPCRDKNLKSGAIKLKVPEGERISFRDFVLDKEVAWESEIVADTTLLKTDGLPTYHLAVVVDDHEMEISHVLRGHDWMPSSPIHLLVYKYLDYKLPEIGHLTDILDPEGGKLSKRKGSTSCEGLLEEGYLPEAILNFVILLGWAPKDNRELFTLAEFVEAFDPKGFQKSNPVFNRDKLDWFNGHYTQLLSDEEFASRVRPFAPKDASSQELIRIAPLVKTRIKKLSEFQQFAGFFFEEPEINKSLLEGDYKKHIDVAKEVLESLGHWNLDELNERLMNSIKENGFKTGDFFMTLRVAVAGSKFTPPINDSIIVLGKDKALKRLNKIT